LTRIRNRLGTDLFKRTQNRLTLQYSGLLMLFLGLFIVFVFAVLYFFSLYQQEVQIKDLANQEVGTIREFIEHNKLDQWSREQNGFYLGQEQFFYYLVDSKGQPIVGDEIIHPLRPNLLKLTSGWTPTLGEVHYQTLQFTRPGPSEKRHVHQLRLLITGIPLISEGHVAAVFYVGRDVSFQFQLLQWFLLILIGLALLFALLAIVISHFMSKRAMIPIIQSYTRQREFVADASHELRTPLSVLLSSIDTLEMEESIEADEFSSKILSNMKGEVKRMSKLVGNLLTLARSDSETLQLSKEHFDFKALVEKIVVSFDTLAAAKHINLQLKAPEQLVIRGDADRLTQLLYILLDNSIKYTPDGGNVSVLLSLNRWKQREWLTVAVKDSGIGIKSEVQDRIFDRFYREDKARSREQGGHGLGLAIAKWIVEAHEGSIQVDSVLEKGSTFTVTIPLS
jgi:signal transduction histidine kinase